MVEHDPIHGDGSDADEPLGPPPAPLTETPLTALGDDDLAVAAVLADIALPRPSADERGALRAEIERRFASAILEHARAAGASARGDDDAKVLVARLLDGIGPTDGCRGLIRRYDPRRCAFGVALAGWVKQLVRDRIRGALAGLAGPSEEPAPLLQPVAEPPAPVVNGTPVAEAWGGGAAQQAPWSALAASADEVTETIVADLTTLDEPADHPGVSPEVASFRLFADAGTLHRFGRAVEPHRGRLAEPLTRGWALAFLEAVDLASGIDAAVAGGPPALRELILRRDRVQAAVSVLAGVIVARAERGLARRLCRVVSELEAFDDRIAERAAEPLGEALDGLRPPSARFEQARLRPGVEWWWFERD